MNSNSQNINEMMLRQYSEVLQQEIKATDEYAEFSKKFRKLAAINSISKAKELFFELCNRNAEDGSFIMNECKITVDNQNNQLRICLDSPKDYYSFVFFKA